MELKRIKIHNIRSIIDADIDVHDFTMLVGAAKARMRHKRIAPPTQPGAPYTIYSKNIRHTTSPCERRAHHQEQPRHIHDHGFV